VHDVIAAGRTIRVLSVVDAFTRECLGLELDTSFASRRVTRVLDAVIATRGKPEAIRCDNGPELTSRHFLAWGTGLADRTTPHSAWQADAERTGEELSRTTERRMLGTNWFANLFGRTT
jgi:putative transposase